MKLARPSAWQQFVILFGKDIRQEMNTRSMLSTMGVYSLLVLVIFGAVLAQRASEANIRQISGGLIWAMTVFTSLLGLNRSFSAEREDGGLDGLLLIPIDRSMIFLAKAASNFVFGFAVQIIGCLLFYFFFLTGFPIASLLPWVLPALVAGSIGIAGIGTLLATITNGARSRDILLAILFVPVIYPLLYAVVAATGVALSGALGGVAGAALPGALPGAGDFKGIYLPSLALALGYDVVMLSLSWLLYDFVVSDS